MRSIIIIALCLFTFSGCGSTARESALWAKPIPDMSTASVHMVTPHVYRCFEPTTAALKEMEKQFGIRSVISLRPRHKEQDEISGLQLATYRVKMHAGYVDSVALKEVLSALRDAPKPLVIYSWEDSLSVATAIAAYRIAEQGWTATAALDELEHGNYGHGSPVTDSLRKWFLTGGVERIVY